MNKLEIKKHFTYSSSQQIWRILISETDKIILETRDIKSREVFFHCFDLIKGKKIFRDYQHEEKSWIGIESIYKDIIFFHRYIKPDMPWHKEVIAFDIASQKILWSNEELTFHFVHDDKIFCFKQGFEERYFYSLNYKTGELLDELGSDYALVNSLKSKPGENENWSLYLYPQDSNNADEMTGILINDHLKNAQVTGNVEFIIFKNLVLFNYHNRLDEKTFNNNFVVANLESGSVVLNEILNAGVTSLYTDSFFIYKNFLFLLKEKNEVIIFNLE